MFLLSEPLEPSRPAWNSSAMVSPVHVLERTMSIILIGSFLVVVVMVSFGYVIRLLVQRRL